MNLYIQIHNFQNFRTINTFTTDIYNGTVTLEEADNDQSKLLLEILSFRKQVKEKNSEKKQKKKDVLKNVLHFLKK